METIRLLRRCHARLCKPGAPTPTLPNKGGGRASRPIRGTPGGGRR